MITVHPTIDPKTVREVLEHPRVWSGFRKSQPTEQVISEYINHPGCACLAIRKHGDVVGVFELDFISDATCMGHDFILPQIRGSEAVHAIHLGFAWTFGRLGYDRVQGRTSVDHPRALRFATAMAGMHREFVWGEEVYTSLSIYDWPWSYPKWFARVICGDPENPLDVLFGMVCRLAAIGAAWRGAWIFNDYALCTDTPLIDVIKADESSALVRQGNTFWRVGAHGCHEVTYE